MTKKKITDFQVEEYFKYLKIHGGHLNADQQTTLKVLFQHYRKNRNLSEQQRNTLFELWNFLIQLRKIGNRNIFDDN